ncbi:heavy-metal-associated domain-containing protein [Candidatus Poribacteria bacterium]|nr:heavy-metal-associated domain-containing protein [Candidatus Poribacteria bacterium]
MARAILHSDEISCDGCVRSIRAELSEMEGVQSVAGDPDKQEVTVEFAAPATLEALKAAMDDIGYPVDATR